MNVSKKVLYLVAITFLYCCIFPPASWKPNLIHIFSTVFFFFLMCVCIFFFLGQYSECLHLFDISHLMPLKKKKKAVLLLQCNSKMWNQPKHNMHDKHRLGAKALNVQTFSISIQKSKTLLQSSTKEYIIPTGKTQKRCVKSSEGGAVDSVRLLQFNIVMLALIPD